MNKRDKKTMTEQKAIWAKKRVVTIHTTTPDGRTHRHVIDFLDDVNSSGLCFSVELPGYKVEEPEKSERKIDGRKFRDWIDQMHVTAEGDNFDVLDCDGEWLARARTEELAKMIRCFPDLMYQAISLVDNIRRDGRLGKNPEMLTSIIIAIKNGGFIDDLIEGEYWE